MTTTVKLGRPIFDPTPDQPLRFYGFRIRQDGSIFATTTPYRLGRISKNFEVYVGSVEKVERVWVGRTLNGLTEEHQSQWQAADWAYKYAEEHQ